MTVTSNVVLASALAAGRPPNPAPMMTTRLPMEAFLPLHRQTSYGHQAGRPHRRVHGVNRNGEGGPRMSQVTSGRVPIRAIRSLIEDALATATLPRPDATVCACLMGEADLTGADA